MLELPRTRQKSELASGSAFQPRGEMNNGGIDNDDRASLVQQKSLFILEESKDYVTHREVDVLEVKGSQPYRNQDHYLAFESGNLQKGTSNLHNRIGAGDLDVIVDNF